MVLNRRREPFTGDGFRSSFFKLLRQLQKENKVQPGLTFHGFTRTRVREMYKAGATKLEIMAAVGHITPKMVDLYLQELDRGTKLEAMVALGYITPKMVDLCWEELERRGAEGAKI